MAILGIFIQAFFLCAWICWKLFSLFSFTYRASMLMKFCTKQNMGKYLTVTKMKNFKSYHFASFKHFSETRNSRKVHFLKKQSSPTYFSLGNMNFTWKNQINRPTGRCQTEKTCTLSRPVSIDSHYLTNQNHTNAL